MGVKAPVFISLVLIILPLLLFAGNTDIFVAVSFIILFILSADTILFSLKSKENKELIEELERMKKEFEKTAVVNIKRLELGFKTIKVIFISTFVVTLLFILNVNPLLFFLSVLVLFFSVVELKNYSHKSINAISFVSSIINLIYLAGIVLTKYVF